jgi:hypothetical protein
LKTRPRFPLGLLELDRDIGAASPYEYVMENEMVKRRVWHIDVLFGLAMAGIIGWAYWVDGTKNQSNAIKPTVTQSEYLLLCLDGMRPVDYQCPDGERL